MDQRSISSQNVGHCWPKWVTKSWRVCSYTLVSCSSCFNCGLFYTLILVDCLDYLIVSYHLYLLRTSKFISVI